MVNDVYRLEYLNAEESRNINVRFSVNPDEPWYEVLRKFTEFLSHVYGYDVTTEVMKGIDAE